MRRLVSTAAGAMVLLLLSSGALFADGFGAGCGLGSVGATVSTQDSTGIVVDSSVTNLVSGCGGSAQNSGTVNELVGEQGFTFQQFAEGSVSARASLGSLGAEASADASSTPASYTFTNANNESEIVTDGFHAQAGSAISASWFDTFTNSNPDTLELQLHAVFHGSCTPQCFNGIPPFITAQTLAIFQVGCSSPPFNPFAICLSDFAIGDSTTIFLDPGAVMQVSSQLGAQASAFSGFSSGFYTPPNSSSANAFNSLGFYISVVGDCNFRGCGPLAPGETYDTASGHTYSLDALNASEMGTAPEPSSLLLFGSGLAGLAACRRKTLQRP